VLDRPIAALHDQVRVPGRHLPTSVGPGVHARKRARLPAPLSDGSSRALPPRRRRQDLEPDAAGTPASTRGVRPAARRVPRPSTDAQEHLQSAIGPTRMIGSPGTDVAHASIQDHRRYLPLERWEAEPGHS
jgi:hypothetical protein